MSAAAWCPAFALVALLVLSAWAGPVRAQQAGDNVLLGGWVRVRPPGQTHTVHTRIRSGLATTALGIPEDFDSPGTSIAVGTEDTLGLAASHFFTDHFAVSIDGGLPLRVDFHGHGTLAPPGLVGGAFQVNLGDPDSNPIGSGRLWNPALLGQYRFGDPEQMFRPFVNAGFTVVWFTGLSTTQGFEDQVDRRIGQPLALVTGHPGRTTLHASTGIDLSPVGTLGLAIGLPPPWGLVLAAGYSPIALPARIDVRAADGTRLARAKTDADVGAMVTAVFVSYDF